MKMKISVTAQHIEHGVVCDCSRCPVALAFAAVGLDVVVAGPYINFFDIAGHCTDHDVAAPPAVQEFVHRFDLGLPVNPFEFELDIPQEAFA